MTSNEHVLYNQNETINDIPEKKGMSKKLIATISGIALTAMLLSGCGSDTSKATNPNQPTATATAGETQKQPIPVEAKSFVDKYGSRYADPVATYYAVKGYGTEYFGVGSIIGDGFVDNYDLTNMQDSTNGQLGFETLELPATTENSQATALNVFNEYTAPNLTKYMNWLSKNPGGKTVDFIDNAFRNYCSNTANNNLPNLAFTLDDEYIDNLMNTAKSVVSEYGSTADYTVAPASINETDPNKSSFPSVITQIGKTKWHEYDVTSMESSGVRLVINVDNYNSKGEVSHINKTFKNTELIIIRQPDYTGAKSNIVSIGKLNP